MSDWKEFILGQCITIKHGYAFKGTEISDEDTGIRLVTPGNFHIGGGFKTSKFKYYRGEYPEEYKFKGGEIVVTMTDLSKETDALGYAAKVPFDSHYTYLHNQRVGLVQFVDESVHQDFIYWLMRTYDYHWFIVGGASGTSIMHTSPSRITEYLFNLPSLPEQRTIASVLSSLDDKIDLLHRQNKTLEAMAETLFRQWFVEEEGDIVTVKLGDIIEIFDSKRVPLSSTERDKMKDGVLYPYYGAAKVMDYINQYIFDGEYLLLGEDGTVQTDGGFPILQLATGKYWVNNHTHVLNAKKPFNNFLLYIILRKISISHIVTGAVQPKINQENLKSLKIEVPNNEQLEKTAMLTDEFWKKTQHNLSHIRTLENLRDTLLPKLMSGEVRVEV